LIHLTEREGIAVVTLDRPPVNAFDDDHQQQLDVAITEIQRSSARAVLIRSASAIFSAGADIAMIANRLADPDPGDRMAAFATGLQKTFNRIAALRVPSVAEIVGVAAGGGLELALACDVRIAGASARLGLPEVTIGLLPGAGGTQRVTQAVGRSQALRLLLTGDLVDAHHALQWGLVQEVAPDEELAERCGHLVAQLALVPATLSESIKACVDLVPDEQGFTAEIDATRQLCDDPITAIRVRSFLDRKTRSGGKR
jgi:enoyl-CoA hydratase/carnithine racemase